MCFILLQDYIFPDTSIKTIKELYIEKSTSEDKYCIYIVFITPPGNFEKKIDRDHLYFKSDKYTEILSKKRIFTSSKVKEEGYTEARDVLAKLQKTLNEHILTCEQRFKQFEQRLEEVYNAPDMPGYLQAKSSFLKMDDNKKEQN